MNLTIKDRVLILKCVLPIYDSRRGIELKNSILEKIYLSDSEEKQVVLTNVGNDQIEVSFKSVEAITQERNFELSEEELKYLKQRIDFLDQDGRFSDYTLDTYSKIADEPLPNTEDTSHVEEQQTDME
ncbi:hypothetical protein [Parabacteroides distasonis]|uniref:hypothetical protein n=1 Tax=Parabacteroides distasonis TaxID=823 RepID=UPI0004DABF79|nr:hypothetical protein [Parabacteroides distasonis]KDS63638.1 hypothetical protein M095_3481 [Parabacteroides distasonis str. 3999B T(B) 4]KDS75568.1 hypothetical protein M096_2163 [Parabacteroides distasonis str. 3999B T(B) 6]